MHLRRISSQNYYEMLPTAKHRCGDIWSGIDDTGLLGGSPITGLVVTPACDLSNDKTETVTLLPIIPLKSYFSTTSVLPTLKKAINSNLTLAEFRRKFDWGEYDYRPPALSSIEDFLCEIDDYIAEKQRAPKHIDALERAQSGFAIAKLIATRELTVVPSSILSRAFRDWSSIKSRLITNAYSTSLHFLPADGQNYDFSGLSQHSLVLFRFPITIPIELLDLSNLSTPSNWVDVIKANTHWLPYIERYHGGMPIKTLTLKSEFLSDLLSRYVNVYNRIGSPDFTADTIRRFAYEVDE